jgi:hypothetical protein
MQLGKNIYYNYKELTVYENGFFREHVALAILIMEDVCCLGDAKTHYNNESIAGVYVNCNDVFAWASADAEPITFGDYDPDGEIESLYKLWTIHDFYGPVKWCCMKRKMRPQKALEIQMKAAGFWDTELERLPIRDI